MPVDIASLATTPYIIGSPGNLVGPISAPGVGAPPAPPGIPLTYRSVHTIYPLASALIKLKTTPPNVHSALTTISGDLDPAGDAIYLKFFADMITSIRLPCPAPPGVNLFFTDNLSGCKFYVDKVNGSSDLIVYHANTQSNGAGPLANCDVQTAAADTDLNRMHFAAQADYAPLVLGNIKSCAKPTYFLSGGVEERRKAQQGRTDLRSSGPPKFMGLCTIVGFPSGGSWDFWFQTCGDIDYKRSLLQPDSWSKIRTEGMAHKASYETMEIYDYRQI